MDLQVLHVCLNHGYAAVLVSSGRRRGRPRVVLHSLRAIDPSVEGKEEEDEGVRRCFDAGLHGSDGITCMALTDDFLVVGTERGQVRGTVNGSSVPESGTSNSSCFPPVPKPRTRSISSHSPAGAG